MKMNLLVTATALLCFGLTSCESGDNKVDQDLDRIGNYLDSVKTAAPVYTEAKWDEIQREYNTAVANLKEEGKELSAEANKKLEEVKADYNNLKEDYSSKIKAEKDKNDYKVVLRKSLFGDQEVGNDMQFKFVTAGNALSVYERFVNTVKENKENYSREDWDEIKVLYEALDTRKNEIEKDLASSDNVKIARKKIEFAAVKAVRRPLSKVEENEKAKQ